MHENADDGGVLSPATPTGTGEELFGSDFLAKLEHLHLLARRLFRGRHRAERRSRRTGSSLEFADYRNYVAGDDLRRVDWNIYGRLDRLFLKLFEEEEDLPVHILVDASGSMRWRPVADGRAEKFDFARRVAASLAYIGLAGLEHVNLHFFADDLGPDMGMARGKARFHDALQFLAGPPGVGDETSLATSLRSLARRLKRPGIAIVISDLLDPAGYEAGLNALRHARFDVQLVQVLHPSEVEPRFLGDWRAVDCETGEAAELTTDERMLREYGREVAGFLAGVERFCRRNQIGYVRAMADVPFEDVVLLHLRAGGVAA